MSVKTLNTVFAAVIAAVVVASALSGCASSGTSPFTGDWGQESKGSPSLTIKDDGTFTGNDGCNAMEGKGTISGDTFTFGPFATTQVFCEGVSPWLNLADTATVDGDTLTVYKTDGDQIGTLDKR